jgi:hypothetical protein
MRNIMYKYLMAIICMPRMNKENWSEGERRDATWTHGDISTWTVNINEHV